LLIFLAIVQSWGKNRSLIAIYISKEKKEEKPCKIKKNIVSRAQVIYTPAKET